MFRRSQSSHTHRLPLQNCIICTFLNRRGLLADDVYQGDLAFGRLMRTHLPFMHEGYWLWAK
jgi:hypothetical protein